MHAATALMTLAPIEAAIIEFYSQMYGTGPRQIVRGALRKCAKADKHLNTATLREWINEVKELADNEELRQEALDELETFIAQREGRKGSTPPKVLKVNTKTQSPLDVEFFNCRLSAFEILLVDFYARRAGVTREQTLRHFLRMFASVDKRFDRTRFAEFVAKVSKGLADDDQRKKLKDQTKAFLQSGAQIAKLASRSRPA